MKLGQKVIGKLDKKRRMVVEKMPNITTFTLNPKKFHWDYFCSPKIEKYIKIHTSCDKFYKSSVDAGGWQVLAGNMWCSSLILPSKNHGVLFEKQV